MIPANKPAAERASGASAGQDAEPSMEEILASIRSLIADDAETRPAASPQSAAPQPAAAQAAAPQAPVQPAAPQPSARMSVSLEPAPVKPAETPPAADAQAETSAAAPRVVWRRPAPVTPTPLPPAPAPKAAIEEPEDEAPLLSDDADAAASSSFAALSTVLALQSSNLAERMVGEMLRPMLKSWLDENLPSIVERLVRAEIQRVARGRG